MTILRLIFQKSDMDNLTIMQLIPQREPILMVDELLRVDGEQASTCFTVSSQNIFLDDEGNLEESGIIEHIAQSASAFAGYKAIMAGAAEPPVGYIGEVKKFRCYHRPKVGNCLRTFITLGVEVNGVTLLTAKTYAAKDKEVRINPDRSLLVAETSMKIYIKQ